MSLEKEIADGNRAERLQSDLAQYFTMVEDSILDKWKESPVSDVEGQHKLRLMLKLLGDLQANINTVIETGKMASIQLENESKLSKVKNLFKRA